MRRPIKVKASRVLVRKAALSASPASRRPFPAWIVADESGVAFPAKAAVTPRVRDGLVLRRVSRKKSSTGKSSGSKGAAHDHGAA
jgi:hypothetical protein